MSVSRKIFIALVAFIVSLSLLFVWVTNLVVREALSAIADDTRGKIIDGLSAELVRYYSENDGSWEGLRMAALHPERWNSEPEVSFALLSGDGDLLAHDGSAPLRLIKRLGIQRSLMPEGTDHMVRLYYYDREAANLIKLKIGIPLSVNLLMSAAAVVFLLLSLPAAFWIARRLTAPLGKLIEAIDRLGKGNYGVQATIESKDEYGKVALAFNGMSADLERAEQSRRSLVADVAHELRTPLTIVQGRLDLLQQGGRSVEPESLLPLQDELIRLTRLVDDLHQLAQAESGHLRIERQQTDLNLLLQRVIERMSLDAELKAIGLTLSDRSASPLVMADPNRLTQVFLNLLVNAVRYTPESGTVAVRLEDETRGGGQPRMLKIAIVDNGPGIAPAHLPYLFNRFYRADEARSRNSGGMGLGLAIAREFVLAHEGMIEAASVPGEGTTITVRLPALDGGSLQ